jgi:hypothetical protein
MVSRMWARARRMAMRRIGILAALLVAFAAGSATAQGNGVGLGVIIGEPTGLSMKFWQSRTTAVDLAAAWSFADDDAFHLHGDVLFHKFGLIKVDKGRLPLYFGIGGRVKFLDEGNDDDVSVGIRIPVGLAYLFGGGTPLDIFVEVVPILDLTPDSDVTLNASFGLRYWFH